MASQFWQKTIKNPTTLTLLALALSLPLSSCGRNQGEGAEGFEPGGVAGKESFTLVEVGLLPKPEGQGYDSTVAITVLDRSAMDGYWVYRSLDANNTFNQPVAYSGPFQTTFNQGYQFFNTYDRDWQPNRGLTYMGRGVVNGTESQSSSITNKAYVPPRPSITDLFAVGFEQIDPADTLEVTPLLEFGKYEDPGSNPPTFTVMRLEGFHWEPVQGATRYLVQCVRSDGILFFVALTPNDGSTSIDLRDIQGPVLHTELPLSPSTFFWTVDALDNNWRVVGHTFSRQIFVVKDVLCDGPGLPPCP